MKRAHGDDCVQCRGYASNELTKEHFYVIVKKSKYWPLKFGTVPFQTYMLGGVWWSLRFWFWNSKLLQGREPRWRRRSKAEPYARNSNAQIIWAKRVLPIWFPRDGLFILGERRLPQLTCIFRKQLLITCSAYNTFNWAWAQSGPCMVGRSLV